MTPDPLAICYGVAVCLCIFLGFWVAALWLEVRAARRLNRALVERVASQSELLTRKAGRAARAGVARPVADPAGVRVAYTPAYLRAFGRWLAATGRATPAWAAVLFDEANQHERGTTNGTR